MKPFLLAVSAAFFFLSSAFVDPAVGAEPREPSAGVRPITGQDHIWGNPSAPVKVVEYADTECPFCKKFHSTLHRLADEYGKDGKIAWVFRHFPIAEIHPKAPQEAQATECAAALGGNDKFWAYLNRLYQITPSNNRLDLAELPRIAEHVGLDRARFEQCLASGKYAKRVEEDFQDAVRAGGKGTPYTIVIAPNGKKFAIEGAQPYETVQFVIDIALDQK